MMRFFWLIIGICSPLWSYAIHLPTGTDAKTGALGGVQIVGIGMANVYTQSAALAWHSRWRIGTTYTHAYFSDKNLSTKSLGLIAPVNSGTFGLQLRYFGFADYHEQFVGLSYGKALGQNIAVGAQLYYYKIAQGGGYGSATAVSCDISMYAKLTDKLDLGVELFNPVVSAIGPKSYEEKLPMGMRLGTLYRVDECISLMAEVEQRLDIEFTQIKLGIEYALHPQAYVRAGYSNAPQCLHAGFGLCFKAWHIDMATRYHQSLGFSPLVTLSYVF